MDSFHQTLRSGGDLGGAFGVLANPDGLRDNITDGGGLSGGRGGGGSLLDLGGLLGLGVLDLGGLLSLGGNSGSLLLLGGLASLAGVAEETTEDRAALLSRSGGLLLGSLLGGLGGAINGRHSRGGSSFSGGRCGGSSLNLGRLLNLGSLRCLLGGGRPDLLLGAAKELAEREVLLLLAGSGASGLGLLDLGCLSSSGRSSGGLFNLGSLNRNGLSLLGRDRRSNLMLLLLVGGALQLLDEAAKDGAALGGLRLLLDLLLLGLLLLSGRSSSGNRGNGLVSILKLVGGLGGLLNRGNDRGSGGDGRGRGYSRQYTNAKILEGSLTLSSRSGSGLALLLLLLLFLDLLLGLLLLLFNLLLSLVLLSEKAAEEGSALAAGNGARLALGGLLLLLLLLVGRAAGRRGRAVAGGSGGLSDGSDLGLSLGGGVDALLRESSSGSRLG